ncbi:MAG: hypothetical protein RML56_14195 [Burkholderiales bacterium]|nr:hypothetical protein [Burkholderiales bacterium]
MPYKIGLDIGTASCALVALSLDDRGSPTQIVYHSLYIFPEPLLPSKSGGVGESKKAVDGARAWRGASSNEEPGACVASPISPS